MITEILVDTAIKQEGADIVVDRGERWIIKPMGDEWATTELLVDTGDTIPANKQEGPVIVDDGSGSWTTKPVGDKWVNTVLKST